MVQETSDVASNILICFYQNVTICFAYPVYIQIHVTHQKFLPSITKHTDKVCGTMDVQDYHATLIWEALHKSIKFLFPTKSLMFNAWFVLEIWNQSQHSYHFS